MAFNLFIKKIMFKLQLRILALNELFINHFKKSYFLLNWKNWVAKECAQKNLEVKRSKVLPTLYTLIYSLHFHQISLAVSHESSKELERRMFIATLLIIKFCNTWIVGIDIDLTCVLSHKEEALWLVCEKLLADTEFRHFVLCFVDIALLDVELWRYKSFLIC